MPRTRRTRNRATIVETEPVEGGNSPVAVTRRVNNNGRGRKRKAPNPQSAVNRRARRLEVDSESAVQGAAQNSNRAASQEQTQSENSDSEAEIATRGRGRSRSRTETRNSQAEFVEDDHLVEMDVQDNASYAHSDEEGEISFRDSQESQLDSSDGEVDETHYEMEPPVNPRLTEGKLNEKLHRITQGLIWKYK